VPAVGRQEKDKMANARKSIRPAPKQKTKARTSKLAAKTATSKLDQITKVLRSARGATISDLTTLTGWQPHSVRGALAGALKKKRGLKVHSARVGDKRVYRIAGPA
jgi:hypothetical protein